MNKPNVSAKLRARGRPREFDPDMVLEKAMEVFLAQGFSATSLDDLAAAMDMNRPSLYNAFGNKVAIYRCAFARFADAMRAEMHGVFVDEPDLKTALLNFYKTALGVYFRARPASGCFIFCTAPVEALAHAEIRQDVREMLDEVDRFVEQRFQIAQADGQFPLHIPAIEAARIAQAVLHSLALRARAGESRRSLLRMAKHAVALLCANER